MKNSTKHQSFTFSKGEAVLITRTQIYVAVAFIYVYFLTTIFL